MKGSRYNSARFSFYAALSTTALTIITFGIAVCTPPLSGPFCTAGCFQYPYSDIISRFPRDYYWMYPAILLSFSYLVMMLCIHHFSRDEKKLFSSISVAFALISTLILTLDYFVQVSFIQPSLMAGETEGIAFLSQYNPHGIFIIMEELGFITMNFSFFALIPVFSTSDKIERGLRFTFITGFILMLLSLILVVLIHGINREYRFEVIIISINWLEMIISGVLLVMYFRKLNR